eukprot:scaffold316_cov352-Pavlova_lutheri.AAC.11
MWRRFRFFEKEEKQDLEGAGEISCACGGRGQLVLGREDGRVQIVDRGWKTQETFVAHQSDVKHVQVVPGSTMMLTVGKETGPNSGSCFASKLWDLEQPVSKQGTRNCLQTLRGTGSNRNIDGEVTCCVAALDPSQKASMKQHPSLVVGLGMANGDVLVFRGNIAKDKYQKFVLQTAIDTNADGTNSVTGLGLGIAGEVPVLYVVTKTHTMAYDLATRAKLRTLDEEGCERSNVCTTDKGQLIVGRKEAVYMYEVDGRGPCFAFPGDRRLMKWWQGYLITVDHVEEAKKLAVSNTVYETDQQKRNDIKVYDLKNKLIVCNLKLVDEVLDVVFEWDGMVVVQKSCCLYLREKDMASKLEILFQKDLYVIALNLVPEDPSFAETRSDVHRRYGDHLYKKGDYSGAMEQYIETIGLLEPSYVIRKFLDAQRINSLTMYLEKLHEKGLGGVDHTTLLLNCYTRLKDVSKLDAFIAAATSFEDENEMHAGKTQYGGSFDVSTAIRVLRGAEYFEHALFLSKQAGDFDWYFRILFDDLKRFEEGIEYVSQLDPNVRKSSLLKHGKTLLDHSPTKTTAQLMELCTAVEEGARPIARATEFLHIYIEHPQELLVFLEFIVNTVPDSEDEFILTTTLLELYLARDLEAAKMHGEVQNGQVETNKDSIGGGSERREKALHLLQKAWPDDASEPRFDSSKALMLCQTSEFSQGLVFLYERMGQYREVLEVYMSDHNYRALIDTCRRYSESSTNTQQHWLSVLDYFVNRECIEGRNVNSEVEEVLECIHEKSRLPPMLVLQTLSKNKEINMEVVQGYLTKSMDMQSRRIEEAHTESSRLEKETAQMEKEIKALRTKPILFQNNKCSACMNPLDLPSVHFFCMHSYHQRCLEDTEAECPICAPLAHNVWEIQSALARQASDPKSAEKFFRKLEDSPDGFSVVAEQFSRGLFAAPRVEDFT